MSAPESKPAPSGGPVPLRTGLTYERALRVEHHLTIQALDPRLPAVYGTPAMIMEMEIAAANAVQPALPPGAISVGTQIHVEHLAATPLGLTVRVRAELIRVDGRFLDFKVEAWDDKEMIGRGTVSRAIVDVEKFRSRVAVKVSTEASGQSSQ